MTKAVQPKSMAPYPSALYGLKHSRMPPRLIISTVRCANSLAISSMNASGEVDSDYLFGNAMGNARLQIMAILMIALHNPQSECLKEVT
jgi:hypothetical protein